MKKSIVMLNVLLVLMITLSACAPTAAPEPTNPPVVVPTDTPPTAVPTEEIIQTLIVATDDLGVEIVLAEPAQKIISITPSLTEILFSVGAGDRLIGRDSNSMYPEEAAAAVDLGGMWEGIPVEDILAMEPDLILAGEIFAAEAIQELRDLGLVVYWQKNPADFEGLFGNIMDIAVLTGTEDVAGEVINSLTDRVSELDDKLASIDDIPLVFYELDASDPANPYTPGAGTFISFIISRAKGLNLGDSLEGEWVQVSSEELLAQNPDTILLADYLYGITPEIVAERAGWSEIKAVVDGEIYPFDPFVLSVPGPRLVDGFEQVAEILHPEVFDN
ncbi:MAG: ABC transporter substrate-binding protein [Anaerolineales bacterium]|nr:ABC transporter substrate-binding protein [Anaerolineales bacterium]